VTLRLQLVEIIFDTTFFGIQLLSLSKINFKVKKEKNHTFFHRISTVFYPYKYGVEGVIGFITD